MVDLISPWHAEEAKQLMMELVPDYDFTSVFERWDQARSTGSDLAFRERLLKVIREFSSHCTRCNLHQTRTRTCATDGSVFAEVLLVGEVPGYSEDLAGLPFVCAETLKHSICGRCSKLTVCHKHQIIQHGRRMGQKPQVMPKCDPDENGSSVEFTELGTAGELLTRILRDLSLSRRSWGNPRTIIAISNAVRCYPAKPGTSDIRKPVDTEVLTCSKWLKLEALLIQPKVTVLLGKVAVGAVLGYDVTVNPHTSIWYTRKPPFGIVLMTFHPAYLLRNGADPTSPEYNCLYRTIQLAVWCANNRRDPNPVENPYVVSGITSTTSNEEEESYDDLL